MMDGEKITFRGEGDQQVCFITINRPLREEMFAGHFNFVDLLCIYIYFFFESFYFTKFIKICYQNFDRNIIWWILKIQVFTPLTL